MAAVLNLRHTTSRGSVRVAPRTPFAGVVTVGAVATSESCPSSGIWLRGQRFGIEHEEGRVFLVHPKWSLVGSGASLDEARADLMREARDLADDLSSADPAAFGAEVVALRAFLSDLQK